MDDLKADLYDIATLARELQDREEDFPNWVSRTSRMRAWERNEPVVISIAVQSHMSYLYTGIKGGRQVKYW